MCDYCFLAPGTCTARSAQSARQPSDNRADVSWSQIIIPHTREEYPPSSLVPTSLLPAISRVRHVRIRRNDPGIDKSPSKHRCRISRVTSVSGHTCSQSPNFPLPTSATTRHTDEEPAEEEKGSLGGGSRSS